MANHNERADEARRQAEVFREMQKSGNSSQGSTSQITDNNRMVQWTGKTDRELLNELEADDFPVSGEPYGQ